MIDPKRNETIIDKIANSLFGDLLSPPKRCEDTPEEIVKRAKERKKKKEEKKKKNGKKH